jgi:NADPH:quinone reductase-like Zn-dependent oxidoreductase
MTATQALHLVGCFKPGDTVIFHAGASAVSIAGIQLAKQLGQVQFL